MEALHRGKKLEAIRILRMERGIGLKEARILVEQHVANDPGLQTVLRSKSAEFGAARLFRLVAIVALLTAIFLWWKSG